MENNTFLEELVGRYPQLLGVRHEIGNAAECMINCFEQKRKILVCGNGGSSADAGHIVGELMKEFEQKRPLDLSFKKKLTAISADRGSYLAEKLQKGLPAISLSAHDALITAFANDADSDLVFAQQVAGYGQTGDIIVGISTSGNSQNIIDAIITAKAKGMIVLGLTGETGGRMKPFCDILINVPARRTSYVQELHLPVYHTLCLIVEDHFFGNKLV